MEFTLSIDSANKLICFAKSYIDLKLQERGLDTIQCEVTSDKIVARCINAYSFAEITLPINDFKGEEGKCFLITPNKLFHKSDETVRVLIDEKKVTYNMAGGSLVFEIEQSNYKIFDTKGFWREPKMTIYFNPKLLIECLKPYVNNKKYVRIDCLSPNDGFIISQDNEQCKSLVLPVKKPRGE